MKILFRLLLLAAVFINSCASDTDTYTLTTTVVPEEAGTVTPAEGEFEADRTLEISASPNESWAFERWEGDHEGTQNPVVITMDSDKDIAAIFAKRNYTLTVNTEGEGSVSERVVQQKTTDYPHGTVVELTAEADAGWVFAEWQGDLEGDENPVEITIDGEMEVTAIFTRVHYPLTIDVVGEGSVDEEIVQVKQTDYPSGSLVKLTAEPDENWIFSEWEGDIVDTENPIEIVIDAPKEITAVFLRTFRLTTISVPEEGGTIEPAGGDFVRDSSFNVEAIPNEGWRFVEWRGDFTATTNPFNLTMNGNKTLEAYFEPLLFSLETNAEGEGEILTNVLSGGNNGDQYEAGSVVELTALPAENWEFESWEGDVTGTANPATVTIDGNKSVTAVFRFFGTGDGTIGNPYQISTLNHLQEMENYPDSHFILMQDIDAAETSGWNGNNGFNPIGDDAVPFTGSIDGNGFEILNLTINRPLDDNIGLFGYIGDGAVIQNISLTDADITGSENTGVLAGQNDGEILNASVTGTVNGDNNLGGLVGLNGGSVHNSFSEVVASGDMNVGGLAGSNISGISKSYALGEVSGVDNVGGLVGENMTGGLISETFASSAVSGFFTTGGLVGINNATVENSYWDITSSSQTDGVGTGSSAGMTELTTTEMTGPDAEMNMPDFDWVNTWTVTPASYPILQWQEE